MPLINVSGNVAHENGEVASGVVVAVAWVEGGVPQGPALGQTDAKGTFNISFRYNTHTKTSWIRGDICREKVTEVSVSAFAPGYVSVPVLAQVSLSTAQVVLVIASESP